MAWTVNKTAALSFAFLASLIWLIVDLHSGHPYQHPYALVWNSFIRLGIFVIITELISLFKNQLDKEKNAASHDSLTHLLNRSSIEELIEMEINRVKRYGSHFALVYIDLDYFKQINDQFGHQSGDNILRKYGKIFQENLRVTDKIARLGGDEFLLLLPETNQDDAELLLKKIEAHIKNNPSKEEPLIPGFSAGIFVCDKETYRVQELINNTDKLMYYAKQRKKNPGEPLPPSLKN